MTLQELQKKNEAIRKRREATKITEKPIEIIEEPVVQEITEKPVIGEVEKEEIVHEEEVVTEKAPIKSHKGRKPANREYMVVENIEDNN